MFGRKKSADKTSSDRVPIYKRAECVGPECAYYPGKPCDSRLELLDATGKSGGKDLGPLREDCSFALYGRVCTGGDEQVIVERVVESPNNQADALEMVGRTGRTDGQHIVLETPRDSIVFVD